MRKLNGISFLTGVTGFNPSQYGLNITAWTFKDMIASVRSPGNILNRYFYLKRKNFDPHPSLTDLNSLDLLEA